MAEDHSSLKPHLVQVKEEAADEQLSQRVRSLRLPQNVAAGNARRPWATWTVCLLLAGSTAVLGYLHFVQPTVPPPAATAPVKPDVPASPVPTAAPAASSGGVALESKGYIIPAHQILVSPKVGGMVVKLRITESQRVAKGDVLAEMEDTEYRADRDRAKAMLESARQNLSELEQGYRPEEIGQARAELAEADAQRVQLEADYKRSAEMLAKKVISREAYDSALSKYQAMERRVQRLQFALKLMEEGPRIERINVAQAQVGQAEAELAKAQWRLDNCIIRAPISGTILKKNAEEGSLVNPIAMQGFLQSVRDGRPLRPGSGSDDPGARHQQDFQGPEVQGPGRGLSRPRLRRIRVAADAHRRSGEGGDPRPREGDRARRRRRRLSEAGDGGAGVVPEEVGIRQGA